MDTATRGMHARDGCTTTTSVFTPVKRQRRFVKIKLKKKKNGKKALTYILFKFLTQSSSPIKYMKENRVFIIIDFTPLRRVFYVIQLSTNESLERQY